MKPESQSRRPNPTAEMARAEAGGALYEMKVKRRVEFADTDMAGIMHFSNFFRFMETAETAFMRALGFSIELAKSGLPVCLPRVHASCDFFAPLRFEDEVLIHLLVERKQARTLTYQFRFHRVGTEPALAPAEVAVGRVIAVCAARQANGEMKAVPIPDQLAQRISEAPRQLLRTRRNAEEEMGSAPVLNGALITPGQTE